MSGHQPFLLVHTDPDLVVVDKSAGILTVPTARGESNTLVQRLRRHLGRGRPFAPRLTVVHRLDREVSGLLVFARSEATAQALQADFARHRPEREYAALVAGVLPRDAGTFASRLVTGKGLQRFSTERDDIGEEAVTHYRVERRLAAATLVTVRLETGRRNQIRVHFAEAGHPILGETRYRPDLARHPAWSAGRLALHARLLAFVHPTTGQALRFESPLPSEFVAFLRRAQPGGGPARVVGGETAAGRRAGSAGASPSRGHGSAGASPSRGRGPRGVGRTPTERQAHTPGPGRRTSAGRSSPAGPGPGPRSYRPRPRP